MNNPGTCRLSIGSATSPGRVRERNEDSHLVLQATWVARSQRTDLAAVVVADGMGGYQSGDRASALVLGVMGKALSFLLGEAVSGSLLGDRAGNVTQTMTGAFQKAHQRVVQEQRDPACKDMGSTAVALVIWNDTAYIGLVGDCRVYHSRAGRLTQVTRDQTVVARMVEMGLLRPEQAATHAKRNEITQAIGHDSTIQPVLSELKIGLGDWLVACCDGLYAHVTDQALQEAISRTPPAPYTLAQRLVDLANQGGGSDNCTVVTMYCF